MKWKSGLVVLSAAGITTVLLFVVAAVVFPMDDPATLAGAPVQSAAAPATRLPPLPGPRDALTLTPRPTLEQLPPAVYPDGESGVKPVKKKAKAPPKEAEPSGSALSLEFDLSSFNVLGSSHTATGGTKPQMAPGVTRIRGAATLLTRHEVDVVGFQELQLDQLRAFLRIRGGTYDAYPGSSAGNKGAQNSIAWRTDMWEMVRAYTVPIPYFNGNRMPMPVVLLRHRATGLNVYFTNFHNPASTRLHPNQQRWRKLAALKEVSLVNRLRRETGYQVFLTGDMNEREEAFCMMTGRTAMIAANGGTNAGSCRPPRPIGIDWIFGSAGVTFSNYRADRSPLVNRTTDHPMIVSHVRIGGETTQRRAKRGR